MENSCEKMALSGVKIERLTGGACPRPLDFAPSALAFFLGSMHVTNGNVPITAFFNNIRTLNFNSN